MCFRDPLGQAPSQTPFLLPVSRTGGRIVPISQLGLREGSDLSREQNGGRARVDQRLSPSRHCLPSKGELET